ncbi:helix-turn-helix domain-containing protein [Pasteurella caecimuris]|uniref:helix-turn-helix domain-containing protein n=1 Tax=Rodentibacter caecimuris TaxID=1796644 RepID=UPI00214FB162|nr:helix-turn-helix domain-containing protein [Pasteurella caecimuris]MCR1838682.1 helix-turn-helix domain-containing protein [Pasteurella caecimuris]MCU0108169.1 helix-turn-helix domain-containing protein [Pasteurella caecimuris]
MENTNLNEKSSQSQNAQILAFMQNGGKITSLMALDLFGCMRLSARILDLRNNGYHIYSKTIKDPKSGKRFSQYFMETRNGTI